MFMSSITIHSVDMSKNAVNVAKMIFSEQYVLSDVYLTENTSNFIRLFLQEGDGRNLKEHLNS